MSQDEKPNLKCRMYESRYPVEGSIVMGKVSEIDGNEAVVYLVEYRKRSKLLLSAATPPVRVLTLKRMEAFRVLRVNVAAREVVLDENPVPLTDIWEFESRFNEAKFVHSVIYSVADDMKMDLKEAYKLAGWPSLKKLKTLHEDEKFLACKNVPFKTQLIDRIALMRHDSWRIKDPGFLQSCTLKQKHDICYSIALTRQAEAFFKKNGKLSRDSYLSIQDVFNKAVDAGLVEEDWTISELVPLVERLEQEGFVLDQECPLTYSRDGSPLKSDDDSDESDRPELTVPQMAVLTAGEDVDGAFMQFKILDALEEGPLTCSVFMFPSYTSVRKDVIFEPTADEKVAFEKDNGLDLDLHTMLLTGDGVDRHGVHYLEFQDCLGDVRNGDRGFLRFAVEPNTVAECVIFKDYYDHDMDFD